MFGQFVLNYSNYSEPEIGAHYEFIWQCYSCVTVVLHNLVALHKLATSLTPT